MSQRFSFKNVRALIIDIDGTLWRGNQPLPGLAFFFDSLQQRDIAFVVVTNNTVKTPNQYRQKFAGAGVVLPRDCVLTASVATADYLKQHLEPGAPLYVIGQAGLRHALGQAGFTLLADASRPAAAVVVGGDTRLTYQKLKCAVLLIQRGAQLIGANPDLLIPTEEGLIPEAGVTLAALQAATGVSPVIIGKPERPLFELALQRMAANPGQTAALGDRLETDILGGQRAGLKTILVTTGVDNRGSVLQKQIQPDVVVDSLSELVELW